MVSIGQGMAIPALSIPARQCAPDPFNGWMEGLEMTERKSIKKSVRFEVFKRDGFKCQYCGAAAPEAILEVDHINPVSKGGDNDIMNLITACKPCNSGKSDRELSDDSAIQKQRAMLDDLNERREQLEMMLQWREGLKDIGGQTIQAIKDEWASVAAGYSLNEKGEKTAQKLLRSFPLQVLLDAIQVAGDQYIKTGDDGNATEESVNLAWSKIGGIARNMTLPNAEKQLYYIRGICRNRFNYCNDVRCLQILKEALTAGCDVDEMTAIAKEARNWTGWTEEMYDLISKQGE